MEKELNIKEEKKPFDKVEKARMEIKRLEVTANSSEQVTQVRFVKSDDSSFTWKPKKQIETETKHRGLPVITKDNELLKIEELPEKLYSINNFINEKGVLKIVTDYTTMNTTDKENKPVSYDFVNNKQFETMYFLGDNDEVILEL